MNEYRSLHQRLLAEGYEADNCFKDSKLPESLTGLALDVARGKYERVKVVPADLALQGEEWIPVEQSHLVYATLSETEARSRKEKGLMILLGICSRHRETGEEQFVPLPGKQK